MYSVHDGSMGDYPPVDWVANGTLPMVPLDLSMVLPRGKAMERTFPTPAPDAGAVVASLGETAPTATAAGSQSVNWAQWGQDMLTQGIQDTKGIIGSLIAGSGRKSVQEGFDTTFQQQLAQQQAQTQAQLQAQQMQMQMQLEQQKMQAQLALAKAAAASKPTVQAIPAGGQQVYPMIGPGMEPKVEKKFPPWGWVLIGLGGAGAVAGVLYFTLGRKKAE